MRWILLIWTEWAAFALRSDWIKCFSENWNILKYRLWNVFPRRYQKYYCNWNFRHYSFKCVSSVGGECSRWQPSSVFPIWTQTFDTSSYFNRTVSAWAVLDIQQYLNWINGSCSYIKTWPAATISNLRTQTSSGSWSYTGKDNQYIDYVSYITMFWRIYRYANVRLRNVMLRRGRKQNIFYH